MQTETNSQQGKVWFITGASTGFGRLLSEHVLALGGNVVATARRPEGLKDLELAHAAQVQVLTLDVTDRSQIDGAVQDALARFGHVDVLVNNAGYGLTGAFEEVDDAELKRLFDTNVFGLIHVTKALLPHFRQQRAGHIVNLSSVGGLVGLAGWSMYNATKFAVEGMSEALATELEPLGISVTIVEPGPFRTDFLGRSGVEAKETIADYQATAGKTREYFRTQAGKQAGDPQKAVEAIVAAVSAPKPPRHLLLGKLALMRFRQKIEEFQREVAEWEQTTVGADFAGAEPPAHYVTKN
jgi:NAD(P)-dependent dehydrogenase (short-subunit alcohol dehydrogenase family)